MTSKSGKSSCLRKNYRPTVGRFINEVTLEYHLLTI